MSKYFSMTLALLAGLLAVTPQLASAESLTTAAYTRAKANYRQVETQLQRQEKDLRAAIQAQNAKLKNLYSQRQKVETSIERQQNNRDCKYKLKWFQAGCTLTDDAKAQIQGLDRRLQDIDTTAEQQKKVLQKLQRDLATARKTRSSAKLKLARQMLKIEQKLARDRNKQADLKEYQEKQKELKLEALEEDNEHLQNLLKVDHLLDQWDNLRFEVLEEEKALNKLSEVVERSMLGTYLQDMVLNTLNSDLLCKAQSTCASGKQKGNYDAKQMGEIFKNMSIKQGNIRSTPRGTTR